MTATYRPCVVRSPVTNRNAAYPADGGSAFPGSAARSPAEKNRRPSSLTITKMERGQSTPAVPAAVLNETPAIG